MCTRRDTIGIGLTFLHASHLSESQFHFLFLITSMPKSCNVCPDCGRLFKSTNGLSLHRNYCVKRPPRVPCAADPGNPQDDKIHASVSAYLECSDGIQDGEIRVPFKFRAQNGTNTTDYSPGSARLKLARPDWTYCLNYCCPCVRIVL